MTATERLIDEVMAGSRILFTRRHREVLRELRAQVEDFVNSGRQSGRGSDIKRLLVERSGDRRQFAWVYWHERAALDLGALLISTLLVSLVIPAAEIVTQAGMAFGFGAPDVACIRFTANRNLGTGYSSNRSGICRAHRSGEIVEPPLRYLPPLARTARRLRRGRLPPQFVLLGFANGAMVRGNQVAVRRRAGVLHGDGRGILPPSSSALVATTGSWLIMGSACHQ